MRFIINRPHDFMYLENNIQRFSTADLPANVYQVQWTGPEGYVEYTSGCLNARVTDASPYQPFLNEWMRRAGNDVTMAEVQAVKLELIELNFNHRRQAPILFQSRLWDAADSVAQAIVAHLLTDPPEETANWPWHPLDSIDLVAISLGDLLRGILFRRNALNQVRIVKRDQVKTLLSVADMISYDANSGWE